jgi:hypothetical protein
MDIAFRSMQASDTHALPPLLSVFVVSHGEAAAGGHGSPLLNGMATRRLSWASQAILLRMDRQPFVRLELSADEALVFFEFVSRFTDSEQLSIEDQAETIALWNICGQLERQLSEPFSARYSDLLARARERLRGNDAEAGS